MSSAADRPIAMFDSGFGGLTVARALIDLAPHEDVVYSHKWEKNMLVMWDSRSLLHAASGGYDGYDRLLHRTTIADTAF